MNDGHSVILDPRAGAERAARPASDEYGPTYGRYVERVPDGDIVVTLERNARDTAVLLHTERARERADHRYADGKWSVKEVVGHVIDAERVFMHRALRFARADATPLPGFEENEWVPAGRFGDRTLDDLVEEFLAVRNATLHQLRGLPRGSWSRRGQAAGSIMSVRGLAWATAGHELHHRHLLQERYLA